jgi:hypothetical protein
MSAQPAPSFTVKDAKTARCSYQHITAIVDRILNRIIQGLSEKDARAFKPSVFATIHSLHGFFNGREVSKKRPLIKAHKFVAPHFEYRGDLDNCARFMDRRLDALAEVEFTCGHRLIEIERANNTTLLFTAYEGHPLLDAAEWAYLMARSKPDYWKNPALAVSDDLLDAAIAKLPDAVRPSKVKETAKDGSDDDEPAGDSDLMTGTVLKGRWTKVINTAEQILIAEYESGADPEIVARKHAAKIIDIAKAIKARHTKELLREAMSRGEVDTEEEHYGKNSVHTNEGGSEVSDEPTLDKNVVGAENQVIELKEVSESEIEPDALSYALRYAARGWAVLPLWGVADGICDCPSGSECRSAGKHPHSTLARRGVYNATVEEKVIRAWFEKDTRINIGIAMGGRLNLICVDVDPRNDGDASYCDLVEAHGDDAFPQTYTQRTGGNGWHKPYRLPEKIKSKKGELKAKLGPGVDVKGEGGFIVAAPSMHASGRRYEIDLDVDIPIAPDWMVQALTKAQNGEQPEKVVDFQARRDRKQSDGNFGRYFEEGERNSGLRDVACGRWVHGYAKDAQDLYQQMIAVRNTRCAPGKDSPATDAELWELVQRTTAKFTRGQLRDAEGAA